nr:ESPR-type extended signal peptide-containing protein [uncultured Dialister sp.]
MNRIYKVIYSKARQCSIVVSEFAKSSHKNSRKGAGHTGTLALARIVAAALVAGTLTWGGVPEVSWAADNTTVKENTVTNTDKNIKDINANITGKGNTVIDSSNAEIVGDGNIVTNIMEGRWDTVRSNDVRIHGSGNFISGSRNQQVIGDNNKIIARDRGTVTDYQHPEGREENVSDLTIGRGNVIQSNDTYRNEWDSLKVIGNNNRADGEWDGYHAGGPSAGIIIGDNQNLNGIQDTIVIGSLAPSEQQEKKEDNGDLYTAGSNNIIIGYHTTTTQNGGIVIGNRSQGSGVFQTIMGPRSIIGNATGNPDSGAGTMASIYGAFNKVEDAGSSNDSGLDIDGLGNSVNGSLNITSNARGTMIMGVGNTITHAKGPDILGKDEDTPGATGYWVASGLFGADYYAQGADTVAEGNNLNISYDEMRNAWQKYMETSGGAVSVLGNSNNADYAIRSQILGTGNTLQGSETDMSAYNTVSGFANTGTNIKRSAIVGTGNNLKNGEDNVVIGDYHNLENGKHNVILGSMDYTEKQVTKQSKSAWAATEEHPDGTFEYTVTEQVPVKNHHKDIENAVMVGYNTDVTQNGGVALGADSIADTQAGVFGWDPKTNKESTTDSSTWKSSWAAVSVGDSTHTRQITNVAAGFNDTDAVNVAQLKNVENQVASNTQNINYLNGRVGELGDRINKVGAGAAALAALHPLDFDPNDKWNFAAGFGNYRNANSTAIGAFYRPNADTMFSVATNFGNGENMINAGVSFKLGRSGKSPARLGSTQEIKELQEVVARQDDQLKKQDKEIRELKTLVQQLLVAQENKTAD